MSKKPHQPSIIEKIKGTELERQLDDLPLTYPQLMVRTNKPGKDIKMSKALWQALNTSAPMMLEASYKADRLKASLVYGDKMRDYAHSAFPAPKCALKPSDLELLHAILGLFSEAGELLEMFMHRMASGLAIDRANAIEELGDAGWFLQLGIKAVHSRAEEVQQVNILKLVERFPDGYSDLCGLVRDQESERNAIEQSIEDVESKRDPE